MICDFHFWWDSDSSVLCVQVLSPSASEDFFSADLLLYSFGGNPCLVSWKPLNLITSALTKSVYTRLYLKRYSRSLASVGRLYEITQWMYCEPVKETCYSRDTAIMI